MEACDLEKTLTFVKRVPPVNPYARSAAVAITTRRSRTRRRPIADRAIFAFAFVATGMSIGAIIGLLAVRFYS